MAATSTLRFYVRVFEWLGCHSYVNDVVNAMSAMINEVPLCNIQDVTQEFINRICSYSKNAQDHQLHSGYGVTHRTDHLV